MASNSAVLGTISSGWKSRAGSPKYGVASLNGNGSTTAFTISHGLGGNPNSVSVLPLTDAAAAKRTVTKDGTNITVTYAVAPPSGTGNLKFRWSGHRL